MTRFDHLITASFLSLFLVDLAGIEPNIIAGAFAAGALPLELQALIVLFYSCPLARINYFLVSWGRMSSRAL